MARRNVLITGASGYIASQLLPTFREIYNLTLIDVTSETHQSGSLSDVKITDLLSSNQAEYACYFNEVDSVLHLGNIREIRAPIDCFSHEMKNVEMAYNVLRTAYKSGVRRVVVASSNHAADWYEHSLIHQRKMEVLDPYMLPLSDNFYGWAKATYEHMGFLFASGFSEFQDPSGRESHTRFEAIGRKMEVVMVRIGAPRDLIVENYLNDLSNYKRDLGAYISPRDLVQIFTKSIETPDIDNEHGIPWQVVYGISNNTRAFWSLVNARSVLGYQPKDDSEIKYANDIKKFLVEDGFDGNVGRVGTE